MIMTLIDYVFDNPERKLVNLIERAMNDSSVQVNGEYYTYYTLTKVNIKLYKPNSDVALYEIKLSYFINPHITTDSCTCVIKDTTLGVEVDLNPRYAKRMKRVYQRWDKTYDDLKRKREEVTKLSNIKQIINHFSMQ